MRSAAVAPVSSLALAALAMAAFARSAAAAPPALSVDAVEPQVTGGAEVEVCGWPERIRNIGAEFGVDPRRSIPHA